MFVYKKDKITKKAIHPTAEAMGFLAFNSVIATTEYKMIDAKFISMDTSNIKIEVKGIDDTTIYEETDEELNEQIKNGEIDRNRDRLIP